MNLFNYRELIWRAACHRAAVRWLGARTIPAAERSRLVMLALSLARI